MTLLSSRVKALRCLRSLLHLIDFLLRRYINNAFLLSFKYHFNNLIVKRLLILKILILPIISLCLCLTLHPIWIPWNYLQLLLLLQTIPNRCISRQLTFVVYRYMKVPIVPRAPLFRLGIFEWGLNLILLVKLLNHLVFHGRKVMVFRWVLRVFSFLLVGYVAWVLSRSILLVQQISYIWHLTSYFYIFIFL